MLNLFIVIRIILQIVTKQKYMSQNLHNRWGLAQNLLEFMLTFSQNLYFRPEYLHKTLFGKTSKINFCFGKKS